MERIKKRKGKKKVKGIKDDKEIKIFSSFVKKKVEVKVEHIGLVNYMSPIMGGKVIKGKLVTKNHGIWPIYPYIIIFKLILKCIIVF